MLAARVIQNTYMLQLTKFWSMCVGIIMKQTTRDNMMIDLLNHKQGFDDAFN